MTKEKLVDYVMTTPNNPNLAVLNSLIDKHDKDILDKAAGVKTVNSITPDEQGNVAIAYDDLIDKPFGETIVEVAETFTVVKGSYNMNTLPGCYIIEGVVYSTTVNGVYYEAVAEYNNSYGSVMVIFADDVINKQQFLLGVLNDETIGMMYMISDENGNYYDPPETITLFWREKRDISLDQKYLPEPLRFGQEVIRVGEIISESLFPHNANPALDTLLTVGKTYTVNFDGVDYECICKLRDGEDTVYLGNLALRYSSETNTEEPFLFMQFFGQPV